ncbi:RDD family protein [Streptomyces sp. NPDC051104]|uniref:RDD family protein n=1 Tax=Streptomyces sp. NPDC051104 TaxID=3155044 RepID=UPI00343A8A84
MSAPTPAPGDDRPREGYYPDPSIPGYVRYWNGVSWVPGTSRPAPTDGEPLSPPAGVRPAQLSVEETGPHFFDEDPVGEPDRDARTDGRPEPAPAWGADRSQQSGFGGEQDRRVSWGAAQAADPRLPAADSGPEASPGSPGTTALRRPARPEGTAGTDEPAPSDGTMKFRAVSPRTGEQGGGTAAAGSGTGTGSGAAQPGAARPESAQAAARQALGLDPEAPSPVPAPHQPSVPAPQQPSVPAPQQPSVPAPQQPSVPAPQQPSVPAPAAPAAGLPPQQPAAPVATPLTSGPGGGQPSWVQQVHQLASPGPEGDRPVAPWKPPVEDPFQAAARAQAAARPAGLGKRLAARLLDTLVLAAVTGVAAVPLGTKAIDHINGKIDAAKLSGQTVTVWLLDGTTSVYLAIVLAVLLGFGVLYEALPTAKWGRTLGKKVCGLEVRDIEAHEPPTFGQALRRWLVYSLPAVLVVGVVGVLWCVFDRPWRQCWHDKAAHTFVAR